MTKITREKVKNKTASRILIIFAAASFLLFLMNSDIAIEYMKKGLELCAETVIPSLFPFMVISEIVVSSGLGVTIGKIVSKPLKKILGISEGVACAFILGIICGFPIGAKSLSTMLERKEISPTDASRALTFCNNPGSAFVISAVGGSLFGSVKLGVILYACVIISALIIGGGSRLFFKLDSSHNERIFNYYVSGALSSSGTEIFTNAIKNSAQSMLTVCSLVAFFSSFVGCLGAILTKFNVHKTLISIVFCVFELSSGVSAASEMTDTPTAAILLTAAALGWSGLSVHFQIMTVCQNRGISFKPYFFAKAIQSILCAALTGVALKTLPFSEDVFKEITVSTPKESYSNAAFVCLIFFFASFLPILVDKTRKKQCKKSKRNFF